MASMSSRKRKDGSYAFRVNFRLNGVQKQESFDTPSAAQDFCNLIDQAGPVQALRVLRSRQAATKEILLKDWTREYLDTSSGILGGITDGTREGYAAIAWRTFLRSPLAELPLSAILQDDVSRWVAELENTPAKADIKRAALEHRRPKTISAKTVRNAQGLLSQILEAAVKRGMIDSNPAAGVRLRKGVKRDMTVLTQEEFWTIMHFLPERERPLALFLATMGTRWGEATALTFGDIDRTATPPTVTISKSWKPDRQRRFVLGPPKTRAGVRTIGIPLSTLEAIGDGPSDELIFKSPRGNRVGNSHWHVRVWGPALGLANNPEACAAAGLKPINKWPRIHDLRHAHASWLIAQGVPLNIIQRRLGHESIKTTVDTYGFLMPDVQIRAVTAIDQALAIDQ